MRGAQLDGADLSGADLRFADLQWTSLWGVNLRNADLSGAILRNADLTDTNLRDADLRFIRNDVWAILDLTPAEVPFLIQAIKGGLIEGQMYEGECACLVGTLAKARGVHHNDLEGVTPEYNRPAERFFYAIQEGDTTETSQFSSIALEWCEAWMVRYAQDFTEETK